MCSGQKVIQRPFSRCNGGEVGEGVSVIVEELTSDPRSCKYHQMGPISFATKNETPIVKGRVVSSLTNYNSMYKKNDATSD